jgi:hypothetical protein
MISSSIKLLFEVCCTHPEKSVFSATGFNFPLPIGGSRYAVYFADSAVNEKETEVRAKRVLLLMVSLLL